MSDQLTIVPHTEPLSIMLGQPGQMSMDDDAFFEFCQLNRELRIERASTGEVIIMPPTGSEAGRRNFSLTGQFYVWLEHNDTGIGFDSSTGFILPNGAKRSPDLAWIKRERWDKLTTQEREGFAPLCPDFVVEIRSRTDNLPVLQAKLQEYLANGSSLGWLIDPLERKIYIYRPGGTVECLVDPKTVAGEPILPGFILEMDRIW